ncbi:MAG: serine hydrolase [Desulfurococcales archaeon]|nr:serine hydrolase [Desulfurococcales archaeon]
MEKIACEVIKVSIAKLTCRGYTMEEVSKKIEGFVLEKMSKHRVPGISMAVIREGQIIYSRGFGFRDIERNLPALPTTVYGIGSITKSFTSLSIMILSEEGRVSIDDYVDSYIPMKIRPRGERIRIWHLMSHTSGIPALAYAEAYIRSIVGEEESTWMPISSYEDMLAFLSESEAWAEARPGEKYFYLNEGYVLLGMIIEKISGMRYIEFVRKKILEPLGMRRSYFVKEEVEKDPDFAAPYAIDRDGKIVRTSFPFGVTADGGLLSNCLDMAKYISMLINRGRLGDAEIVSRRSIEEMERIRITYPYTHFEGEGYGLGLRIIPNFLGRKLVGHGGSLLVHTAYMGYIPGEGLGVVVLENSSGYLPANIGMYALALMLNRDPEKDLEFIRVDRVLDRLTGYYETYRSTTRVRIERKGSILTMTSKGRYTGFELPLIPASIGEREHEFFIPDLGRRIPVYFRESERGVEMIYERYKYVKRA